MSPLTLSVAVEAQRRPLVTVTVTDLPLDPVQVTLMLLSVAPLDGPLIVPLVTLHEYETPLPTGTV